MVYILESVVIVTEEEERAKRAGDGNRKVIRLDEKRHVEEQWKERT
jgi:hypothetical protein